MDTLFHAISNIVPNGIDSINRGERTGKPGQAQPGPGEAPNGASFADALARARAKSDAGEVKFSRHAAERLRDRGIELSDGDVAKISEGLDRAGAKGARDSLLLYGSLGLIANVPNRTIVTAIDEGSMQEKVFTNIDSTVIIPR
ncbi:MAG: hypothetical protein E3J72_20640 [Planctomycetota bacterium]|nr:MAG: hypothetical protein E3J72_20640 [Planctomycetota bacterium]